MRTITTIEEIVEIIESVTYNYCGLRNATEHDLELIAGGRDYLDCSYDWDFENDCMSDDKLNGSCAIEINEYMDTNVLLKRYQQSYETYSGNTILLIADKCGEYGNDENEIIIGSNGCGANVLAIVNL